MASVHTSCFSGFSLDWDPNSAWFPRATRLVVATGRAGSRLRRLLTAARGRRSHGPGDLGPPPLAHFEALPSVAPRVARTEEPGGRDIEPEKGSLRSPFRAQIPPKRVALAVARGFAARVFRGAPFGRASRRSRRQARGGILNWRETRFARLPGFKSARCSSSSLPLGQKSQGRDLNPRTPDYKSGA